MSPILTVLFFLVGSICALLCLLLILQIGFVRLESRIGRARDGFPPGKPLPHWELSDLSGQIRRTPSEDRWQLLIFVNHTIGAFPELVEAIREFTIMNDGPEVIILAASRKDFCEAIVNALNLYVSIVPVDTDFYQRFRVRVMPFAFMVDASGVVHWVGMANTRALMHVWRLFQNMQSSTLTEISR